NPQYPGVASTNPSSYGAPANAYGAPPTGHSAPGSTGPVEIAMHNGSPAGAVTQRDGHRNTEPSPAPSSVPSSGNMASLVGDRYANMPMGTLGERDVDRSYNP